MVYKEWASDPYFCMKAWERYWEIRGKYAEPAADGARRIVSAAVRSAVQVDVFVNGRLLGRYQVADGSIGEVPVPRGMLARSRIAPGIPPERQKDAPRPFGLDAELLAAACWLLRC